MKLRPVRRTPVVCVGLLLVTAGCGGATAASTAGPQDPSPTASASSPAASRSVSTARATPSASRAGSTSPTTPDPMVLVISVDGFNPSSLRRLGNAQTPGFRRLAREGVSTLNARTALELTRTLPNHTGMMTGLPIGGSRGHRTTMNEDDGRTLEQQTGRYVPGIFDVAHDAGLRTAMYVGKDKFRFLIRSWDGEHGAPDTTGADDGRDKLDQDAVEPSGAAVRDVIAELTGPEPAALTFLHIPLPDAVGHADGFMSTKYLSAVRTVDGYVARILAAADSSPELSRRLTVVLTADHGGKGPEHSDPTKVTNYRIPFFAWGQGVARGQDLYALNPGRRDPGTARPGYDGKQPVRNMDVADLSLSLLGLDTLPDTLLPGQRVLRVR